MILTIHMWLACTTTPTPAGPHWVYQTQYWTLVVILVLKWDDLIIYLKEVDSPPPRQR